MNELVRTYEHASQTCINDLVHFLGASHQLPLLVAGSGGSLTAAHFAALLHERRGSFAKAVTPMELRSAGHFVRDASVMMISAGGRNSDVLAGFEATALREPRHLLALTAQAESPLSKLAASFRYTRYLGYELPSGKDGFLATNSLLAFMALLLRTHAKLVQEPGMVPAEFPDAGQQRMAESAAASGILERDTLIVLHGGWGLPAAVDLESKLTEAALGQVQMADYRNFAHGRHHWLDKRGASTGVVALVTGGSFALEEFWRRAALAAHDRGAAVSVSAGGSFRAVFPGEEPEARAREFGRDLQDVYALEIGGLLTAEVAARGDATTDGALADDAFRAIQRAKAHGDPPTATVSFPYLQPCDSCARAPAACRVPVGNGEIQELCDVCAARRDLRDDYRDRFLDKLRIAAGGSSAGVRALVDRIGNLPEDADHVGTLDGRGRVAYLLADGNGFGVLFAEAARRDDGFATLRQLSTTVAAAGEGALVAATLALLEAHPGAALRPRDSRSRQDTDLATPVLPLITGGDDVFALLPAP